jgi:hypothetical protein
LALLLKLGLMALLVAFRLYYLTFRLTWQCGGLVGINNIDNLSSITQVMAVTLIGLVILVAQTMVIIGEMGRMFGWVVSTILETVIHY